MKPDDPLSCSLEPASGLLLPDKIVSISSHLRTAGLVSQKTPQKILPVLSKVELKLSLVSTSRFSRSRPKIGNHFTCVAGRAVA